jgi:predicted small lipoprotein YifL
MASARNAKYALAVGVIATLLFSGCGLKGPLYRSDGTTLPGDTNSSPVKKKKSPFDRIPAPQAQKQKKDGTSSDTPSNTPGDSSSDKPVDAPSDTSPSTGTDTPATVPPKTPTPPR